MSSLACQGDASSSLTFMVCINLIRSDEHMQSTVPWEIQLQIRFICLSTFRCRGFSPSHICPLSFLFFSSLFVFILFSPSLVGLSLPPGTRPHYTLVCSLSSLSFFLFFLSLSLSSSSSSCSTCNSTFVFLPAPLFSSVCSDVSPIPFWCKRYSN